MTTNREWLYSLDVADLSDWFDAEHVDNTRSAKRAAAVERVRKAKDAGTSIGYAIVGREYYPWEAYETLIELLTDDDDCGQIADMSQKSADCVRNDGKMSETGVRANDVDANYENATQDSREKLEADVSKWCLSHAYGDTGYTFIIKQLNRQAEITRKTEQAAWIQQANGLIHEANVRANELRDELAKRDKGIERLKRQRDEARDFLTSSENLNANLRAMNDALADDNDRLEAERDTLRAENMSLKTSSDECVPRAIKKRDEVIKILKTERDALAADLQDCNAQREQLRQALGIAIDHAHEVVSLVNLDGEVIG